MVFPLILSDKYFSILAVNIIVSIYILSIFTYLSIFTKYLSIYLKYNYMENTTTKETGNKKYHIMIISKINRFIYSIIVIWYFFSFLFLFCSCILHILLRKLNFCFLNFCLKGNSLCVGLAIQVLPSDSKLKVCYFSFLVKLYC